MALIVAILHGPTDWCANAAMKIASLASNTPEFCKSAFPLEDTLSLPVVPVRGGFRGTVWLEQVLCEL